MTNIDDSHDEDLDHDHEHPHFDGATYDEAFDHDRLHTQLKFVLTELLDQEWHTMQSIAAAINAPEPSVSAQIRNLRKDKHGGYVIERRRVNNTYEYRVDIEATKAKRAQNAQI